MKFDRMGDEEPPRAVQQFGELEVLRVGGSGDGNLRNIGSFLDYRSVVWDERIKFGSANWGFVIANVSLCKDLTSPTGDLGQVSIIEGKLRRSRRAITSQLLQTPSVRLNSSSTPSSLRSLHSRSR